MFVFESDNCKFRLTQSNLDAFPNSSFAKVVNGHSHELIKSTGTDFYNNTTTFVCVVSDHSLKEMIRYMRGYPIIISNYTQNELIDLKKDAKAFELDGLVTIVLKSNNELFEVINSFFSYGPYDSYDSKTSSLDPELHYAINLD